MLNGLLIVQNTIRGKNKWSTHNARKWFLPMRKYMMISMLLFILICSGCGNKVVDSQDDCRDTFGFSLQPGEQAAYSENVIFTETSDFEYQATWGRSGLSIQIGLIDEDGYEYLNEEVGGFARNVIEDIPAGTYQFIVRSCQDNSKSLSENTLVVGAAALFSEINGE